MVYLYLAIKMMHGPINIKSINIVQGTADVCCIIRNALMHLVDTVKSYRGADKSSARPWKETNYSDQGLKHYTKTYGVQTTEIYIAVVCTP